MTAADAVRRYYSLVDAGDYEAAAACFTANASMRIANGEPIMGREAILATFHTGLAAVDAIAHEVLGLWEAPDGTVFFEVRVTYHFPDRSVSLPGAVVCTVEDGLFKEQRIYVDFAPLGRR
jgi:ketosteroid isomerase-like protein